MTADNVLLEAFEMVHAAADCSFAEHLGGLLEGGGADEASGAQSSPGDTLKYEACRCRLGRAGAKRLQSLTLERCVLALEFTGGDDVTLLILLATLYQQKHLPA